MFATALAAGLGPWWWTALGVGLVVAVVVVMLLQSLLNRVHEIEAGAEVIWARGKDVARNTATVWMLGETAAAVDAIAAEAGEHVAALTGGEG